MRTNRTFKEGLGESMGSRADIVKQYKKSKNKWNKELKYIKKQNKILFSIAKKSGLCLELKNIKNIMGGGGLPRSSAALAATLPVTIRTLIPHYPEIATEVHIDSLLDLSR